mmetsp:Transcript_54109/g.160504  ORF Transcript_54109/g.160504 Transcript_54109/m.160504 type:complete len:614 (+) Transcript_54109:2410-4251(+)
MHCSPRQQHQVALMMVKRIGEAMVSFSDFLALSQATCLAPLDLRRNVLVKGKIKFKKTRATLSRPTLSCLSRRSLKSGYSAATPRAKTGTSSSGEDAERTTAESFVDNNPPRDSVRSVTVSSSDLRSSGTTSSMARDFSFIKVNTAAPEIREERSMCSETTRETIGFEPSDTSVATRKMDKVREKSLKVSTDEYYGSYLSLRAATVQAFLEGARPNWPLPITSMNEDTLLVHLGLSTPERNQIEGLQTSRRSSTSRRLSENELGLTDEQLSTRAIARLAANPPSGVGEFQRKTRGWLLRPYPLGARFSGNNMSPLPGWLAGAQSVALNMSNVDLPVQLHFALFDACGGYILKPLEMRTDSILANELTGRSSADDAYWPPPRDYLHRTTVDILSMHNLPKRREQRPCYSGAHSLCHKYHRELTGEPAPPDNSDSSRPALLLSLHPIGGFCSISKTLPLPQSAETEVRVPPEDNGMLAGYMRTVHCAAAEPFATFLRVTVVEDDQELAYETAVLGRLRRGYRVFQLRSMQGTRIELACILVRIAFDSEPNLWISARQQSSHRRAQDRLLEEQRKRIEELQATLASERRASEDEGSSGSPFFLRLSGDASCIDTDK